MLEHTSPGWQAHLPLPAEGSLSDRQRVPDVAMLGGNSVRELPMLAI
jgi:hypothetical protein